MVIDPRRKRFCNGYAAQTMFYQSQVYPTENKPDFSAFFYFQKQAKGVQKKPEFYNLASKSQIGNPAKQELRMRIKYAKKLSIFCYV